MNIQHIIYSIRKNIPALSVIVLTFITVMASAQTGNIGTEQVDVVRNYNPILAEAVKINFTPKIPDSKAQQEELSYSIPVNFYDFPYQPLQIRPIKLNDQSNKEKLENVYAKAGYGTQSTPLAEVYINSNRSKKINYGLYGRYISSNGKIENQNYSDLRIGADAKFFIKDDYAIPVNAYYKSDALYYYGYNHDDTSFDKKDIKQHFNTYGFDAAFKNISENSAKIDYNIKLGFSGISDINRNNELNPVLSFWGEKHLGDDHDAGAQLTIDHTTYKGATAYETTIISLKPHYNIIKDDWSVKAAIDNTYDDGFAYLFLDAEFSKDLIGDKLVFVAGANGYMQKNNFETLTAENPFISDTINFRNTPVQEFYGGIRGSTYSNFSFSIKGYLKSANHLPFYINDLHDDKRFYVLYEDANMAGANIELSYFISQKLRFLASLDAFKFTDINFIDKPYHYPTLNWTISGAYDFNHKFSLTTDIFGVGSSYALLNDGTEQKLNGAVDANISATYRYSKYFNLFLNLNNLANYKYQRFYNYPSYGLNLIGGLSFSF